MKVADMAWILCCCGCGVGSSYSSDSTPSLGTSVCGEFGPKKEKKKKKAKVSTLHGEIRGMLTNWNSCLAAE